MFTWEKCTVCSHPTARVAGGENIMTDADLLDVFRSLKEEISHQILTDLTLHYIRP